MPLATLPRDPGSPELAVFWSVGTLVAAGLAGAAGAVTGFFPAGVASALVVALCAAVYFAVPDLVARGYRLWDRAGRLYAKIARRATLRVAHATVILAVSRTGSRLPVARRASPGSGWEKRGTLASSHYEAEGATDVSAAVRSGGWHRRIVDWARRSDNLWSITLIPFLLLLRFLDTGERDRPAPRDIYTLY